MSISKKYTRQIISVIKDVDFVSQSHRNLIYISIVDGSFHARKGFDRLPEENVKA